jgi:hypothetical protein
MNRRRPSLDALKRARDGHLRYGSKLSLRPLWTEERDPVTGHTLRTIEGMGTVEYAPKGCTCRECEARKR